MSIWVLSDLHLAFSNPAKDMSFFGPSWEGYMQKIEKAWKERISSHDLVLIPGDISWAMKLVEAKNDLDWIDRLPGTKVIIKGNHDYWWASKAKMDAFLPSSIHAIQNDVFNFGDVTIGGTRLWDTQEYNFAPFIEMRENPRERKENKPSVEEDQKIFQRDLDRLRQSLSQLNPNASLRIAMTHYPPIGADLMPSAASKILEEYKVDVCVFGHLHSLRKNSLTFGTARGVNYIFASADYLEFIPIKIR
jgi:predicted phosphohydrolase